jgi:hypothetical protein
VFVFDLAWMKMIVVKKKYVLVCGCTCVCVCMISVMTVKCWKSCVLEKKRKMNECELKNCEKQGMFPENGVISRVVCAWCSLYFRAYMQNLKIKRLAQDFQWPWGGTWKSRLSGARWPIASH